jgi:adenylate kinase
LKDDKPEKIKERLREYNRTIDPILEVYKERGILLEIDASPSIEEIHKELVKRLGLG